MRSLPLAHRIVIGVTLAVFVMAAFFFVNWVTTPSYTVLYSDLDDASLGKVVDELERSSISYRIEGGGSRIMVPKSDVHAVRADLAASGVVQGTAAAPGYELLDDHGLNVSDFRQQVDYQRALEGELARMLVAMDGIDSATVRLVLPEDSLFAQSQDPASASILIDTARTMTAIEVETITFLVSAAVEGLEPGGVTVASVSGEVLAASGDQAAASTLSNRNLRMTRDFEFALAGDVERLLDAAIGPDLASVVVRAELDFDELSSESETYDPESAVVIRQQKVDESFEGTGAPPGGTVGVDGETIDTEGADEYSYTKSEVVEESGVDRTVTRTVQAPGRIKLISVAVVMDDGTLTGVAVPPEDEVQSLLEAALGMDPARGDSVAVTSVPYPAPVEDETESDLAAAAPAEGGMMDMIPQAAGGAALLVIAIALFLMTRGRKRGEAAPAGPVALPAGAGGSLPPAAGNLALDRDRHGDVIGLVERQPEEIAVLLRSWLADRR